MGNAIVRRHKKKRSTRPTLVEYGVRDRCANFKEVIKSEVSQRYHANVGLRLYVSHKTILLLPGANQHTSEPPHTVNRLLYCAITEFLFIKRPSQNLHRFEVMES